MISVVIPVLNEERTVAAVVERALGAAGVSEVVVVDDGSVDASAERARAAGARVVTSTLLGKGASMQDGVRAARGDVVVFLDGDLRSLGEGAVERLAAPVLAGRADLVKASFSRAGGRVTALTAKPLLRTFFPEVSGIDQPLGGLLAARRSLLRRIRFETDYGADVGLLLDAVALGARVEQVPIGRLVHDPQSLAALEGMARQVVRVILDRAARRGRLTAEAIGETEEAERVAQAEYASAPTLPAMPRRLILLPVDGVLVDGSFLHGFARRTRRTAEYEAARPLPPSSPADRIRVTAAAFAGVAKSTFVAAARAARLVPGVVEAVVALRRAGHVVGVVSGGSRLVAETVRRRVFADFAVGNVLRFHRGRATGEIAWAAAMRHPQGCREHVECTGNVVLHLCERHGFSRRDVVAVGRRDEHVCLLRASGLPLAFRPESPAVSLAAAGACLAGSLAGLLDAARVL